MAVCKPKESFGCARFCNRVSPILAARNRRPECR